MRLHPATEPEEPGGPPGPDEIARRRVDADREAIDVLTGAPVEVAHVEDRELAGVPVRVYVPAAAEQPLGAIVYLHGGGWVFGSLTTVDGVCRRLADRAGMAVLSVDYRLAPEHPWPAAVEDGEAVLAAVADGAASDLGVDPARVVVAGDSAGGFLATVLARRARDAGRPVVGQALIYPVVRRAALADLADDVGAAAGLSAASMRWYWDRFLGDDGPSGQAAAPTSELDPLAADLGGLPPALVLTAEHDVLRAEGEAYAEALADAGVEVMAVRLLGLPHGFLRRLTVFPQAGRTIDQIAAWARGSAG
jgi:acetyl esterase